MTFEQERLAREKKMRVDRRIQERLAELKGKATPQQIIEIINESLGEEDPDTGELTYEYDEEQ